MKLKVGDVFLIPISPERVAVGQIAHRYGPGKTPWFMVVFEGLHPREPVPDIREAITRPIRLQAITFDPLIRMGRWPRVGNQPPPIDRIEWPMYKIMTSPPDSWAVIDHTMRMFRPARRGEADDLPMRTSVGPIRLEHAAQSLAGLGPWSVDYDLLLPPSSQIAGSMRGKL